MLAQVAPETLNHPNHPHRPNSTTSNAAVAKHGNDSFRGRMRFFGHLNQASSEEIFLSFPFPSWQRAGWLHSYHARAVFGQKTFSDGVPAYS